jgi:hypothetical protein
VARAVDLSIDDVVNNHLQAQYVVRMYGFAPGYAYLSGCRGRFRCLEARGGARHCSWQRAHCRAAVPGRTLTMPGGPSSAARRPGSSPWNERVPFLFAVGDTVRFVRIDRALYEARKATERESKPSAISRSANRRSAMREARLTVRSCGPLVSYQDGGRFGMMRFGVPASGPMDRLAHAAAHAALGRPHGATAIEISLGGLELVCESGEVTCCIAGGDFHVLHSGVVAAPWGVRTLRAGDVLSVHPGRWGSWAYLAFAGELHCNHWAGHTATHSTSGLGGGVLASGARSWCATPRCAKRSRAISRYRTSRARVDLRVVLGPQSAQFGPRRLPRSCRKALP